MLPCLLCLLCITISLIKRDASLVNQVNLTNLLAFPYLRLI